MGAETFDDAGVFRVSDDYALVQTVDFFPPLVDDPFDFGRISAANALSDVYAMGGEPMTALNIVGFPDKELPAEVLLEILRGGSAVCREAGVVILGGHSVRDAEVKYGLAVTGWVHPQRILRNVGARPGDRLILTKPIGSGTLTSAAKQGKLAPEELAEAISVMTTLNRSASAAAVAVGVSACTDVTGFGLVGHAFEMASGGSVELVIHAGDVPLMERSLEFARQGVLTRAHKTTQGYLGAALKISPDVEPALAGLLMDAQTSGGLLIAVGSDRSESLLDLLFKSDCAACDIGYVAPASIAGVRVCMRGS